MEPVTVSQVIRSVNELKNLLSSQVEEKDNALLAISKFSKKGGS